MCVSAFPLSERRPLIMDGLEKFIKTLIDNGILGQLWLNGSFLTKKIEPDDADLVIEFDAHIYDQGTNSTKALLERIASDLKQDREYFKSSYYCDPYPLAVFPEAEPQLYKQTERQRQYWLDQFGSDRRRKPKGLAIVEIGK